MAEHSIPSIDLGDSDCCVSPVLEQALTTVGFVRVRGHGIPAAQVSALRALLAAYFSRPLDDKLRDAITPDNYRGYIPLGFFSPNTKGTEADHYEGYKLHQEIAASDPICAHCDLYGPNHWPEQPPGLREVVLAYWRACEGVGQRLLTLIAGMMAVDPAWFLSLFDQPCLLYTSPSPRDLSTSRMPSSA